VNLPQITALAGFQVKGQGNSLLSLVKEKLSPQPKLKDDDKAFFVFLIFDLTKGEILFRDPRPFRPDTPKDYYYFGNNKAAESQYYLVREVGSLGYLLTTVWNDLALILDKYDMGNSDLLSKLQQMEAAGLVTFTKRKGEGTVNLQKLSLPGLNDTLSHIEEKKKAVVGKDKLSFEELVRRTLGVTSKKTRFVLVIPALLCPGEPLSVLSCHPDYLKLIEKVNHMENIDIKQNSNKGFVCSICRRRGLDVKSGYSASFSRTGVNKIFTTTTINYASKIEKSGFDRTYAVCNGCYQKLRAGEAVIEKKFRTRIAGENAFILPEGILKPLSYNYIEKLKYVTDLAFNIRDAVQWIDFVEAEAIEVDGLYALNIIIYRTDGNSVSVLQIIEDIPLLRFQLVMRLFAEGVTALYPHAQPMSLGSVYHLIPVRKTDKGQVNVQRVLSFYRSLLSGEMVYSKTLIGYAVEALDKGLRQLSKQKLDNYENLNLSYYREGKEDFFIKNLIMSYLVLFRVLGQLELLERPILINKRRVNMADDQKKQSSVETMEDFLEQQGFSKEARALFYLGALVNRVALKQAGKGHKTKPVLNKVNYQGMSRRDILRLYEDVLDLIRHYYEGIPLYIGQYVERFHYYFGSLEKAWPLNEQENVFYIMSGYAYLIKAAADSRPGEMNDDIQDLENQTEEV
jgi:CRISPR-associated protein Csh1